MGLYDDWRAMADAEMTGEEQKAFWDEYFDIETQAYKKILARKEDYFKGTVTALAAEFDMSSTIFAGFMDGINSSLVSEYDLGKLKESTDVRLEVDFEKLYFNMLDAKAKWLWGLPEWDEIFPESKRLQIRNEWSESRRAVSNKVGRNDPCPCGSGKKYKKCCGAAV